MPARLIIFLCVVTGAAIVGGLLAENVMTVQTLRAVRDALSLAVAANPVGYAIAFVIAYLIVAALALPGAVLLTLLGGALFGFGPGALLVSVAAPTGALLAFWLVRWLAGSALRQRLASRLRPIARGIERDGAYYLFTLRVAPVVPFFLVNVLVALTPLPARTFYLVSFVGMLPATLVYVNAGAQIGTLSSLAGLLSWNLLLSLALLAVFPFLARGLVSGGALRVRWVCQSVLSARRWSARRPTAVTRDLIVIGAGSAGLVAAYIASSLRARVTLIERVAMGGECLNSGCVPSKALIRAANLVHAIRSSRGGGVLAGPVEVDFPAVMRQVHRTIERIAPHDSVERYRAMGVECLHGDARLQSPWTVDFLSEGASKPVTLHTRRVIVASGSQPIWPEVPGLDPSIALTTDTVWTLQHLPARLLVLGGGAAGCELAQAFSRLGSTVTLIERADRLMPREDLEVSEHLLGAFSSEGISVHRSAQLIAVARKNGGAAAIVESLGGHHTIECDRILIAMGRRARVDVGGDGDLKIATDGDGCIRVDDWMRTSEPLVFAAGDVATNDRLTHMAGHMGAVAALNALFGPIWPLKRERHAVPRCIFTDPEVARVGITREQAVAEGLHVTVTHLSLAELDRAIIEDRTDGFVRVITAHGSDKILGATVVGARAEDLLPFFTLAMRERIGLRRLLSVMIAYPGWAEAARAVASQWQSARVPHWSYPWLERWHRWRRP